MSITRSVLGTVRIVVDESRCLRVLFRDVRAQVYSKGGGRGIIQEEIVIFGAFRFILHRRVHEDQNQGMKGMHPWNLGLLNKSGMG